MTKKLSQFDLASYESYHDVSLDEIDFTEAESQLTDERKKYLRTAAKEKAGQSAGAGALSSVAKGIYSRMVRQAAVKQLWKEKREDSDVENDDTPLTDVEDEQLPSQPGTSHKNQQQSAAKGTPPPSKKRKHEHEEEEEQDGYDLTEILRSFELPEGQLEFSFEELYKATNMSKTKVKLTGWMLVMSKLAEIQMESTLTSTDELEEQREQNEKLKQVVEKLKQKNTKLTETISQQQSVIKGIQGLLQHSGTAPTE